MAKLINVADDVYERLTELKGKESYSGVIRNLIIHKTNKESLLRFFGKGGVDTRTVKELGHLWKKWSDEYA